jgi:ABC-type multidrug transport system fused ATPase/permease subunit
MNTTTTGAARRSADVNAPIGHSAAWLTAVPVDLTRLSMLHTVLGWLSPRRRRQLILLSLLSLVGGVAELATIGAVVPFIALLSNPAQLLDYSAIVRLLPPEGIRQPYDLIVPITVAFIAVVLTAAVVRLTLTWATQRITHGISHELAARVYGRVLRQPYSFHVARNSSEIIGALDKVNSVGLGVLTPAIDLVVSVVLATAIIVGLVALDPVVSVSAAVLLIGSYWIISRISGKRLRQSSHIVSRSMAERLRAVQEGLGGIRDVLLDGSQTAHEARFCHQDYINRNALVHNNLWGQMPRHVVEALGIVIIALLAIATMSRTERFSDALPLLGAIALGAQRLLPLSQRIYGAWNSIVATRSLFEDVARLADAPLAEGVGEQGDRAALPFTDTIQLRQVGFRFGPETPWILQDVNLLIPRGARVGVSGETGAGKSTLLDVMMGLLAPTSGEILVDGVPLDPTNLRHWQARIAHVPQAIYLADSSVAANIAFGLPDGQFDRERVEVAARRACIHDVIAALPQGYDTFVGERGIRLSGGQRQRIGIARALYREADVLFLDEATSALDGNTEESVMSSLDVLGRDVTVVIVAHRLSTLEGSDIALHLRPAAHASGPSIEVTAHGARAR